jgi:hypothetical protein
MLMPNKFTFELCQFNKLAIQLTDDFWSPKFIDKPKLLGKTDTLTGDHGYSFRLQAWH